jgi:hypothetical protein
MFSELSDPRLYIEKPTMGSRLTVSLNVTLTLGSRAKHIPPDICKKSILRRKKVIKYLNKITETTHMKYMTETWRL